MAKYKFIDTALEAEIDELWKDHGEALEAFGRECAHAYGKGFKQGCVRAGVVGIGVAGLAGITVYLGEKVVKKLKERKLDKANRKNTD